MTGVGALQSVLVEFPISKVQSIPVILYLSGGTSTRGTDMSLVLRKRFGVHEYMLTEFVPGCNIIGKFVLEEDDQWGFSAGIQTPNWWYCCASV